MGNGGFFGPIDATSLLTEFWMREFASVVGTLMGFQKALGPFVKTGD